MHKREPTILPLSHAAPTLLRLVGGKPANLGELVRAGFPVPDGFCITTAAYARVASLAQIGPRLVELQAILHEDSERWAACADWLRQRIQTAPLAARMHSALFPGIPLLNRICPVRISPASGEAFGQK